MSSQERCNDESLHCDENHVSALKSDHVAAILTEIGRLLPPPCCFSLDNDGDDNKDKDQREINDTSKLLHAILHKMTSSDQLQSVLQENVVVEVLAVSACYYPYFEGRDGSQHVMLLFEQLWTKMSCILQPKRSEERAMSRIISDHLPQVAFFVIGGFLAFL